MLLSGQEREQFKQYGFLILREFYDRKTIAMFSDWLDELQEKAPKKGEEAKYYEKSVLDSQDVLVRIEHILGQHNASVTNTLLSEKATRVLTDVLGDEPVLFKDKANYKLPGCRPDKLHQDQAAGWNSYSDFFVTMCIVIDPNTRENAALSMMKSGNYERKLMTEEWKPMSEDDPPYKPEDEYMLLEASPGDVILFDCYIPHGSPANTSSKSRRNLFLTFNRKSDGDMRDKYYADKWASYPPNQENESRENDSFRV